MVEFAFGTKRTCQPGLSDVCCRGKSGRIGNAPLLPLVTQSGHSGGYAILSCAAWRALSCENPSELSRMQLIKSW